MYDEVASITRVTGQREVDTEGGGDRGPAGLYIDQRHLGARDLGQQPSHAAAHHPAAHDGDPIAVLPAGAILRMLDCSRGWAWGYAPDGRVGYVRADAVGC